MFAANGLSYMMCSTIFLSNNEEDDAGLPIKTFDKFCKEIRRSFSDYYYDNEESVGENAFVVTSTSDGQYGVRTWLRRLGFSETPEVWNEKNETKVILFYIPAFVLVNTLGKLKNGET